MRNTILNFFQPQPQYSEEINKKLLFQLYLNAKRSMIAVLLLSSLMVIIIGNQVSPYISYTWLFLISATSLNRFYDSYYYTKNDCEDSYKVWYKKFVIKTIATALLLGSVSILFLPLINDLTTILFVVILVLGVTSGASGSLSEDQRILKLYVLILLLPVSIYFLLLPNITGTILFFVTLLYMLTLLYTSRNFNRTLLTSYKRQEDLANVKHDLEIKKEELKNIFQQTPVGVFHFDLDFYIVDCNSALLEMLGMKYQDIIGFNLKDLPDKAMYERFKDVLHNGKTVVYEGEYRSTNRAPLWVESKSAPLKNDKGELTGGIVLVQNKSSEKMALDELEYMAKHDELTSLHNRRYFREFLLSFPKQSKHETHHSILFYLDLNKFKQINDTLGHAVGDDLLILVSSRLKKLAGEKALLCRLGGDEFAIVIPFVEEQYEKTYEISQQFLEKIQQRFIDAFIIDELHLFIKCSIGIVIIEPKTKNLNEFIRYADISMYEAKREGGNRFAYYNAQMDQKRKALFSLHHDLNYAIMNNELELYYQPIVEISTNTLLASEALLRWNHPTKGHLAPAEFIDIAVESGLIDDIGWWVIESVCRQISHWKEKNLFDLYYISININAKQLLQYRFVETFFSLLERYNVQPSNLKIEITERSLIDNFEYTNCVIKELQSKGVRCAIDDFGIGYSSLSYLQKLSFSTLKIDKEFIKDILTNEEDRFLVESIITIGKRFNYNIIVEGIETQEQKEFIQNFDNTVYYQGYLYSPPVTSEIFEEKFLG